VKLAVVDFHIKSFHFNQTSHFTETPVADSANEHQIFWLAKLAEFFAVFDNLLCRLPTDVRKFFEFSGGSHINVYCRGRNLNLISGERILRRIVLPAASEKKNAREKKREFINETSSVEKIKVASSHFFINLI